VVYCLIIMVSAIFALFAHEKNRRSPIGRFFFRVTDTFGQGELLYTPPALMSIVGAYSGSPITVAWLTVLWTLIAIGRPAERVLAAWKQWRAGSIERIDHLAAVCKVPGFQDATMATQRPVPMTSSPCTWLKSASTKC
jgi:hypothetical protein